ncbi:MAG TPA: methylamine utilization protein [Candidatus Xenobia bacterium]|jgi:plastocyanin
MKRLLAAILLFACPAMAGTITGTVNITTPIKTRPQGPRHASYKSEAPKSDETQNVVVYIVKVDPKEFKIPSTHAQMAQVSKNFAPDVLPIVAGQTVDFPNQDAIFHDVYSESPGYEFEMTGYKGGASKSRSFDEPGIVELFCGIHSGMNAYIRVLQNPFFAKPGADHTYTISNVPPGHYILEAWHPRVEQKDITIDVPASGNVKADFTL